MPEIMLICEIISLNTEYIINLNHHKYTIDKTECPESYAILMALTDYFLLSSSKSLHFKIYTKDLFVYNIMNEYLYKWKTNNWMMSRGQIAAYVDILDSLYDAIIQNEISYKMIKTN